GRVRVPTAMLGPPCPPRVVRPSEVVGMAPSSRGLGHHPLKVETRVRIPLGLPRTSRSGATSVAATRLVAPEPAGGLLGRVEQPAFLRNRGCSSGTPKPRIARPVAQPALLRNDGCSSGTPKRDVAEVPVAPARGGCRHGWRGSEQTMDDKEPEDRPPGLGASRGQDDPRHDADAAAGGRRSEASTEYAANGEPCPRTASESTAPDIGGRANLLARRRTRAESPHPLRRDGTATVMPRRTRSGPAAPSPTTWAGRRRGRRGVPARRGGRRPGRAPGGRVAAPTLSTCPLRRTGRLPSPPGG